MKNYKYIFCGAGYTNLTFLYQLLPLKKFDTEKILVIDTSFNKQNDKTWCFWSNSKNEFEEIISKKWEELLFIQKDKLNLNIFPYIYNRISSIDFYNLILSFIKKYKNVTFLEDDILAIETKNNLGYVKTINGEFYADYVFNSTLLNIPKNNIETPYSLLQHFKGYEIETTKNVFNPNQATFMDFSIPQNQGTAFVYVLPTSATKALVEYTFFTKNILPKNEYDDLLKNCISNHLNIRDYKVVHTEFGVIPMTDYKFKLYDDRIINVGTAGGCVKPSTGYAFKNIQKQVKQIIHLLTNDKKPYLRRTFNDKKFHFYDSILLEVLAKNKMQGDEIFTLIFKKNKPQLVLKFLDNETNIFEDMKIMSSVPLKIFLPVAVRKIFVSCFSFFKLKNK